jgi:hypothetical protein
MLASLSCLKQKRSTKHTNSRQRTTAIAVGAAAAPLDALAPVADALEPELLAAATLMP